MYVIFLIMMCMNMRRLWRDALKISNCGSSRDIQARQIGARARKGILSYQTHIAAISF